MATADKPPNAAGRQWAEKVYGEKLSSGTLPNLGKGYSDEQRAARAVQSIAQGKLYQRAKRSSIRAELPLASRDKQFWRGVMEWALEQESLVQYPEQWERAASLLVGFLRKSGSADADDLEFFVEHKAGLPVETVVSRLVADGVIRREKGVVYLYQDNPTGKRRGKAPKTDWKPPEAMKNAANRLLRKWNVPQAIGATDVLYWELADGTPAFAFRGPALRIETHSLGGKLPVYNGDHHADVTLQKALGLDAVVRYDRGRAIGVVGGAGQTMGDGHGSDGRISTDEVFEGIESILTTALDVPGVHVTLMPNEGEPFNRGETRGCTPYYSAAKFEVRCGQAPSRTVSVTYTPPGKNEPVKALGADFCAIAKTITEPYGAIVGKLGGQWHHEMATQFLLTHSFSLDVPYKGAATPADKVKKIVACGGYLYPSLAIGEVPATNFGSCVLVARVGLALRGLKPYKTSGGAWQAVVYNTDAWTDTTREFAGREAVELYDQLTGAWEPSSYGHMHVLGPDVKDSVAGSDMDVRVLKSTSQLTTELKRKKGRWREGMTKAQIEAASDTTEMRYPYLEVKVNGLVPLADTFPLAVCPTYRKAAMEKFLAAVGFNGELITVKVKAEDREGVESSSTASAEPTWRYGWQVREAILAWAAKHSGMVEDVMGAPYLPNPVGDEDAHVQFFSHHPNGSVFATVVSPMGRYEFEGFWEGNKWRSGSTRWNRVTETGSAPVKNGPKVGRPTERAVLAAFHAYQQKFLRSVGGAQRSEAKRERWR